MQAGIILVTFYWQRQYFLRISPTYFRLIAAHICGAQTMKLHTRNITQGEPKTGPIRKIHISRTW